MDAQAQRQHDTLRQRWQQFNDDWASVGYPTLTYEAWLEQEAEHWRTCARASSREGVYVYTEQDRIANLQETANAQQSELRAARARITALEDALRAMVDGYESQAWQVCDFCHFNMDLDARITHAPDCPVRRARALLDA